MERTHYEEMLEKEGNSVLCLRAVRGSGTLVID